MRFLNKDEAAVEARRKAAREFPYATRWPRLFRDLEPLEPGEGILFEPDELPQNMARGLVQAARDTYAPDRRYTIMRHIEGILVRRVE